MPTVGQFLVGRLKGLTDHVFGVPGDYNLNLYDQLCKGLKVVGTTDEQGAGFAADCYARVRGFGCLCVTYCVGGFKVVNPIAGAFAEKSPVLLISGSPGIKERDSEYLLHHMVGAFESQHKVFQQITCASTILDNPATAGYEIDRVIGAMRHFKQPGYIEVPRDIVDKNIKYDVYQQGNPAGFMGDKENLLEALDKAKEWIAKSKNPVILAGVEIARFNMGKELTHFAEAANIPVACTLLGKSVVNEKHNLFLGIYCGGMSEEHVRKAVEESDCVIMLGVMQTDLNLAFQPLKCDQTNVIFCNTEGCRIRRSSYQKVSFAEFAKEILSHRPTRKCEHIAIKPKVVPTFCPKPSAKVTAARLFEKINAILDPSMAIVVDVGDSLFGACDLVCHHRNYFLAPAFYTSMGFAVPGALGAHCALPDVRSIVIVGDGAFQMTGMELSTIGRMGYNPIVFVLNNKGYTTERFLLDGPFNDIQNWNYYKVPEVIGNGKGYLVKTEEELNDAVAQALKNTCLSIIQVELDKLDATPALRRMTESLSRRV